MLGLPDEIGCDQRGIGRVVGDDADLGGPGEDIDSHGAEKLALRLGDELVAGAHDDVGGLAGEESPRERGDRLHAAERHDEVGARDLHRIEHLRMNPFALVRGRAGDDRRHARGLRGGDAHVRRSDMGVAAGGHVAARDIDRHEALPGDQPGRDLGIELFERGFLRQSKAPHPLGRELDVAPDPFGNRPRAPLDLFGRDPDLALPAVELRRVLAHRRLAAPLDLGQHLGDDAARVAALGLRRLGGLLEEAERHGAAMVPNGVRATLLARPA